MRDTIANLDQGGVHRLRFHRDQRQNPISQGDENVLCVSLEHDRGDVKSPLDRSLRRELRFVVDDDSSRRLRFPPHASWFELLIQGSRLFVFLEPSEEPLLEYSLQDHSIVSLRTLG